MWSCDPTDYYWLTWLPSSLSLHPCVFIAFQPFSQVLFIFFSKYSAFFNLTLCLVYLCTWGCFPESCKTKQFALKCYITYSTWDVFQEQERLVKRKLVKHDAQELWASIIWGLPSRKQYHTVPDQWVRCCETSLCWIYTWTCVHNGTVLWCCTYPIRGFRFINIFVLLLSGAAGISWTEGETFHTLTSDQEKHVPLESLILIWRSAECLSPSSESNYTITLMMQ